MANIPTTAPRIPALPASPASGALWLNLVLACTDAPGRVWERSLRIPAPATLGDALCHASILPSEHGLPGTATQASLPLARLRAAAVDAPDIDPGAVDVAQATMLELAWGVWGRVRPLSHFLREGDRVELYRALKADPKEARRERFARQGARNAGLFARRRPNSKAGY